MKNYQKIVLLLVTPLLFSMSACSVNKHAHKVSSKSSASMTSTDHEARILDLSASTTIDAVSTALVKHRVVFVGESHTNYAHHLNQLAVIQGLHKRWGANTSIGLEMVQRPYQKYLDDYIAGRISEKQMLKGIEWYQRWRYDYRLYRPIFTYAHQHKIPLIALNVPTELTRRVSQVGIEGLNKNERAMLPAVIDRSNPAYKKRIQKVFGMHARTSSKDLEKFLDAQLAWDEGMAFTAANYLKRNPAKRMLIIAGSGHVAMRDGIPMRLDRQLQSRSAVVINQDVLQQQGVLPTTVLGDYVIYAKQQKLPPAGLMGIMMADSKHGIKVAGLVPHGAAEKAGIRKGDIILSLDNQPLLTSSDVRLWGLDKKPGDSAQVKLKRQRQVLVKTLELQEQKQRLMPFMHGKGKPNPHKASPHTAKPHKPHK